MFEPSLSPHSPPGELPTYPAQLETKSSDVPAKTRAATRYRPRRSLADRVREAVLMLAKGKGYLISHEETAWASITFSGTRHEILLEFKGRDAVEVGEELIANLPEHEFTIPSQLVAEATVTEVDHQFGAEETLTVTAVLLLLEES